MLKVQDYSIKKKLTWINMLVSGAALLLACVAFLAFDRSTFQATMARSLSIQAQIAGANSASALLFSDPDSARNTLSALKAAPSILFAGIYTPAGEPLAIYWRDREGEALPLPPGPARQDEGYWVTDTEPGLGRPVVFHGQVTGTGFIPPDFGGEGGRR